MDRHLGRVYDFVFRTVRDRVQAAELTQLAIADTLTDLVRAESDQAAPKTLFLAAARAQLIRRLEDSATLQANQPQSDEDSRRLGLDGFETGWARAAAEAQADREAARVTWIAATSLRAWQYVVLDLALRQGLRGDELGRALGANADEAESARSDAVHALELEVLALGVAESERYRHPGELFAGLTAVPLPVELRNAVWRAVVEPWPGKSVPGGPAAVAAATEARLQWTRGEPAPEEPVEAPAAAQPEPPATSPYVPSRAANELLARTRRERLPVAPGDAHQERPRRYEAPEYEPTLIPRPVRLRARGRAAGVGPVAILAFILFAAGVWIGTSSAATDFVSDLAQEGLFAPARAASPAPPPATATQPPATATPAQPTAAPASVVQPTAVPSSTPTMAAPTATSSPVPTSTRTAAPSATATSPAPTATRPPPTSTARPPTATPIPAKPTAEPAKPTAAPEPPPKPPGGPIPMAPTVTPAPAKP